MSLLKTRALVKHKQLGFIPFFVHLVLSLALSLFFSCPQFSCMGYLPFHLTVLSPSLQTMDFNRRFEFES